MDREKQSKQDVVPETQVTTETVEINEAEPRSNT